MGRHSTHTSSSNTRHKADQTSTNKESMVMLDSCQSKNSTPEEFRWVIFCRDLIPILHSIKPKNRDLERSLLKRKEITELLQETNILWAKRKKESNDLKESKSNTKECIKKRKSRKGILK